MGGSDDHEFVEVEPQRTDVRANTTTEPNSCSAAPHHVLSVQTPSKPVVAPTVQTSQPPKPVTPAQEPTPPIFELTLNVTSNGKNKEIISYKTTKQSHLEILVAFIFGIAIPVIYTLILLAILNIVPNGVFECKRLHGPTPPVMISSHPPVYYMGCFKTLYAGTSVMQKHQSETYTFDTCKGFAQDTNKMLFGVQRDVAVGCTYENYLSEKPCAWKVINATTCYVSNDVGSATAAPDPSGCRYDASGKTLVGRNGYVALYRVALNGVPDF